MIAITLVFSVMFFIISLMLGGLIGWVYRGHIFWSQTPSLHPEMFDNNGNVIPDEIIAFRFEESEDDDDLED
jgi:hypothetical protein